MDSPRRLHMISDQKDNGPKQEGVHRDIKWTAVLCSMGPYSPRTDPRNTKHNTLSYWCGYVHLDREVTDADMECMNTIVECTYDRGCVMGFDCAHAWDYPMGVSYRDSTYKDFAWVKDKLLAVIDAWLAQNEPQ